MRKEGKAKITISIDKNLLKWIDEKISEKQFGSRSHAIEFALYQLMKGESKPTGHAHRT